jgi:hypothetical protein
MGGARNNPKGKKMIRNLKALGLTLVAVFAMSAMVASAASASVITSDGAVTLKGTETGVAGSNSLSAFGQTLQCPGSTYTGHKVNVTPHVLVPSGATETTITPTYVNCVDQESRPLTVDMNGCDYVFKDATNVSAGTYSILVDIVCPVNKSIEVTGGVCTLKVGAQTNKAGFHLTNTGSGTSDDVDLTGEIKTIKASACGGLLNTEAGIQKSDVTVKGFNSAGVETGVTISG